MCHKSVSSFELGFFLPGSSFLSCRLLPSFFRRRFRVRLYFFRLLGRRRCRLLGFCFFLGQIRSFEALPVESDFRNPDCGEWLAMSAQLLVLFFPFVMEYKN